MILIPFQPRSVDLWTAGQIAALVGEARHVNEPLRALAMLNMAEPMGVDNTDASPARVIRRRFFMSMSPCEPVESAR
jgi:chromosome partitioning protein